MKNLVGFFKFMVLFCVCIVAEFLLVQWLLFEINSTNTSTIKLLNCSYIILLMVECFYACVYLIVA